MIYFEQIRVGGDRNFGYLVGDREKGVAVAIDPSYTPERFHEKAEELGMKITVIATTHGHDDHVDGNTALRERTGARVWIHKSSAKGDDLGVGDGDMLTVGGLQIRVIYTPGHTLDSVCYLVNGKRLVTGDTLFVGKVGGTYTDEAAHVEYDSLKKLLELPDDTTVWPGHDYGVRPSSTIGDERRENPFLLQEDFEAFLHLKNTWAEYKKKHGIA